MKNKKILLISLIFLIIIFIISFYTVKQLEKMASNNKAELIQDNFEVEVYQDTVLVIVSRANGIQNITYKNKDDIETYLECNNRKQIGIDYPLILDREFTLLIEDGSGNTTTERFTITEDIQIDANVTYASNYAAGTINIEIRSIGDISNISINQNSETVPQKIDNKYNLSKEVVENGQYMILVKGKNNSYGRKTINVSEISEDMKIYTIADLIYFRNRVNIGATYEGRTITLMNNLDLSSICGQGIGSWIRIENFLGTFDGNYNTISNLYSTGKNRGLFFTTNSSTIIKNLTIYNAIVNSSDSFDYLGILVDRANGGTIENCAAKGRIDINYHNNPKNYYYVGGLVGGSRCSQIIGCYSDAEIKVTATDNERVFVGGVIGTGAGTIDSCYFSGTVSITAKNVGFVGGVWGLFHSVNQSELRFDSTMKNCYSIGKITVSCNNYWAIGAIAGIDRNNEHPYAYIDNCYYLNTSYNIGYNHWTRSPNVSSPVYTGLVTEQQLKSYANNLGDKFCTDTKGINSGYPILKWQMSH